MKLRCLFFLLFGSIVFKISGQSNKNEVLFKIDNQPVYVTEFLRVYNKNLDLVQDESQKDVDQYLKLFINYKLKLKEAKALGLHEKPTYLRELETYKSQLAKNFITDSKVTDDLIKEAYYRISNDVKASHILIKVAENAKPADTLEAYNRIINLRERAIKEGFAKVSQDVHNGQTVFGEDLGYFTGFRMVYPFESMAFNTNVGEISKPFKTQFGYHIVYVQDKRPSMGERTVAHIMLVDKPGDSLTGKPEVKIQEIYKKIKQGEDFEALAKQFSADGNSAPRGGLLTPFSSGQLNAKEFEDVAFALNEIGDVSEPFKTQYGWHVVKLYGKKPIESLEAMKPELEQKVKRDERSKLIDKALYKKLKLKYNISEKQPALSYFASILNEDYFNNKWVIPADLQSDKPLFKIGNKQFNYKNFADYIFDLQGSGSNKNSNFKSIVSTHYETFLNTNLVKYQEDNLEEENQEFAQVVSEYRDGLLLFELMESTIWNSAKTDSLQLVNFYDANKEHYKFPKRIDALMASSKDENTLKKVAKLVQEGMSLDDIKTKVNIDDKIEVVFTTDLFEENHLALPKEFEYKEGVSKVYPHNDAFVLFQVKELLPETLKTFEEAKGNVISDYQVEKEQHWLNELASKYKIEVNQKTLNKVRAQIKKTK